MMMKIDWKKAPEWANYWAADSSGDAYWYKDKPTYRCNSWEHVGGNDKRFWGLTFAWDSSWSPEEFDENIDWKNTLLERP